MSSVLSVGLTQQTVTSGNPLVECLQFVDGYTWGSVKAADVYLGGEPVIHSMAVQVIGDPNFTTIPSRCSSSGPAENTVQTFGAKGILGVSIFQQDCGVACAQAAVSGAYYSCVGTSCQPVEVSLTQQIQNPVGLLSADNNGVVIDLPSVPATGSATVTGALILGINTQTNNSLGNASVYKLDSSTGYLTTVFNGNSYPGSFLDSGSNALFFPDSGIACTGNNNGFYCPPSTLQLTATNQGTTGSSGAVNFNVANATSLFNTSNYAFSNLAGSPGAGRQL